jgi:hypothetical protein
MQEIYTPDSNISWNPQTYVSDLISNMTFTYSESGGSNSRGEFGVVKQLNIYWKGKETPIQVLRKLANDMELEQS